MAYKENSLNPDWIKSEFGLTSEPIQWAQGFGEFLAQYDKKNKQKQLSTNQIRRFFGFIKRLQTKGYTQQNRTDLLMLTPQLAYAVGRDKKKKGRELIDSSKIHYFYSEISTAINAVAADTIEKEQIHFKNFVNLVEAIVAYHRFASGE